MLSQRQIDQIAKQMYPSSAFPYKERIHLRKAAKEGIAEYAAANPDATYEEILQYYTDEESSESIQKSPTMYITKIIVCIGLLIAVVCVICYFISISWNNYSSPTYYYNLYTFRSISLTNSLIS